MMTDDFRELLNAVNEANTCISQLDKKIDVYIQKSTSETAAFKRFMTKSDEESKRQSRDIHALQIWQAESKTTQDDLKQIKIVFFRWLVGGLLAGAVGVGSVVLSHAKAEPQTPPKSAIANSHQIRDEQLIMK